MAHILQSIIHAIHATTRYLSIVRQYWVILIAIACIIKKLVAKKVTKSIVCAFSMKRLGSAGKVMCHVSNENPMYQATIYKIVPCGRIPVMSILRL